MCVKHSAKHALAYKGLQMTTNERDLKTVDSAAGIFIEACQKYATKLRAVQPKLSPDQAFVIAIKVAYALQMYTAQQVTIALAHNLLQIQRDPSLRDKITRETTKRAQQAVLSYYGVMAVKGDN